MILNDSVRFFVLDVGRFLKDISGSFPDSLRILFRFRLVEILKDRDSLYLVFFKAGPKEAKEGKEGEERGLNK